MSGAKFSQRASVLENEFYHRVDQELIARLQKQHQLEADEDALCMATGIIDRKLLDELLKAEITPKTLIAFSLFPAVFVAWSDGHVEIAEREAILQAAHGMGIIETSPAHQLLETWLKKRPTDDLVVAWKDFIHAIHSTITVTAFRELRDAAMKRALHVAEAAGGILNILSVSAEEKAAIAELESAFNEAAAADSESASQLN